MIKPLEEVIAYRFQDRTLLEQALCHSSYANEHRSARHNERLEFLGDAVLELISSEYLYTLYPERPEGDLSRQRSLMVCEPALAYCARKLRLGDNLLLGKGEDKSGGREKDSLLSDALEALIGAIFLDGGFEAARRFVRRYIMEAQTDRDLSFDAKTSLQELLQQQGSVLIHYEPLEEAGTEQDKGFRVGVYLEDRLLGEGTGTNKKQAEQAAAAAALKNIERRGSC